MRISLLLLGVVGVFGSACDEDESRARFAPSRGGHHTVGVRRPDAGRSVDDEDAGGKSDGGIEGPAPDECARIEAVQYTTDDAPAVTSTAAPADFLVTRQVATWRDRCEQLVIELSNGVCPTGSGHELEIELSREAIEDGLIGFGVNVLETTRAFEAMRVRYFRPEPYRPEGVYGNCEGARGQINFFDAPAVDRTGWLSALYELTLTSCDDERNPPIELTGYFDVRVQRTATVACP
jgi:hypothetical protein